MKELFTAFLVETMSAKPGATGQKYVKSVQKWMAGSSDIVSDMREALRTLDATTKTHANEIVKIFGEFLRDDVTKVLDGLSESSSSAKSDRLIATAHRWGSKHQPEKAQREIAETLQVILGTKSVWVKSAKAVPVTLRVAMRKQMEDKYLIFNIDDKLLGGMRLTSDGKVLDASWLGRLSNLDQLVA